MSDLRATRRARLLDAARANGCDGFLVTGATSIRYLSGFTGSAGALLVTQGEAVLATDGRYVEQAGSECGGVVVEETRDYLGSLLTRAGADGVSRLGAEADRLTWADADRLRDLVDSARGVGELVATDGIVQTLRMVKDADEVASIRAACIITQDALLDAIAAVRPGVSERALAQVFLDGVIARRGDGPSFDPIVATGAHAARPHHRPGERQVNPGDVVLFDVGARFDGYCADLSRTVSVGRPGAELVEVHEVVRQAQQAGRRAVAPGVRVCDVDAAARSVVEAAGFGERFVHGTGHGVGLDIHEPPLIGQSADGRLAESFVVTVEPGVYLPGVGGVRIEDTVLVTPDGAESLTTVPRALIEC